MWRWNVLIGVVGDAVKLVDVYKSGGFCKMKRWTVHRGGGLLVNVYKVVDFVK